ncbi:MAG: hypothetical protein FWD47_01375 [Treponema sp.]|nr:hypothetical protein [Treponema sp.]
MKNVFVLILCLFICSIAVSQENAVVSSNGVSSFSYNNYTFIICLYNDYERAMEIWDTSKSPPVMPPVSTRVTRTSFIMPFVIFGTDRNGTVNLTYDVKVLQPDNTFSSKDEIDKIRIAQRAVNGMVLYRADELLAFYFPGSEYRTGKYQFHINIRENGEVIYTCIMEFELSER